MVRSREDGSSVIFYETENRKPSLEELLSAINAKFPDQKRAELRISNSLGRNELLSLTVQK